VTRGVALVEQPLCLHHEQEGDEGVTPGMVVVEGAPRGGGATWRW
jgi:hypothetical protein